MSEKKQLGQFITEPIIAKFMVDIGLDKNTKKILDPATGPGTFIESINDINNKYEKTVFEVDDKMLKKFNSNINYFCEINNCDYLTYDTKDKYDFIICNPPYNKFQKIKNRNELIELFLKKYNIQLSGYSNYCVYFLIKSINELNKNGKCVYIIPYEFLNCGYGEIVKQYLLDSKMLKSIIKFDSSLKLFSDATTTSCIVILENNIHNEVEFVNIKDLKEIEEYNSKYTFKESKKYKYNELKSKNKWLNYFKNDDNKKTYNNLIKLKSIALVKRGIATGSNNYFTLNKEKIKEYHLSKEVCIPCITKAPDVKKIIFSKKEFDNLYNNNKNVFLFNGENAKSISDFKYIDLGVENKVDKLYLTSHRTPWFSIENKPSAPIWVSVFSRNKLKIIRNELMIKNLTAFHGMYFKDLSENDINIIFCYLLTPIGQEILYLNKREYGEGLDKFEPNDLNNAMIFDINSLSINDKKKILKLYGTLEEKTEETIKVLNNIFKKYII